VAVVRGLVGVVSSVGGTMGVFGLMLAMNALDRGPKPAPARAAAQFDVAPPSKPPPPKRSRPPKPPPKQSTTPPPPAPLLAAGLSGLDLGLFGGGEVDLGGTADAIVGGGRDVVMTADSVDEAPVPVRRAAAPYPPNARAKGITGAVTLSILVTASGEVRDVRVLASDPPGVFDDAAVRSVEGWRFSPAEYQGAPVAVRVEQTLRFDLER
jgi:protein TonB